jgi:NAD(P)-dependent dehydrogenase (short-subunit alcohol dehydrogenase family)
LNGQRAEATPAAGGRALEGKVAVVVGASRGIGAAVARAFSAAGADVAPAARDEPALDLLAGELGEARANALAVPTDVGEPAAVASPIERTVARSGRLDIACCNAAADGHRPMPLADVDVEAFDSAVARRRSGLAVLGRGSARRTFLEACPNRPPCCDVFSRPSIRSATSDRGGRHGTGIGQDRRRHGRLANRTASSTRRSPTSC